MEYIFDQIYIKYILYQKYIRYYIDRQFRRYFTSFKYYLTLDIPVDTFAVNQAHNLNIFNSKKNVKLFEIRKKWKFLAFLGQRMGFPSYLVIFLLHSIKDDDLRYYTEYYLW